MSNNKNVQSEVNWLNKKTLPDFFSKIVIEARRRNGGVPFYPLVGVAGNFYGWSAYDVEINAFIEGVTCRKFKKKVIGRLKASMDALREVNEEKRKFSDDGEMIADTPVFMGMVLLKPPSKRNLVFLLGEGMLDDFIFYLLTPPLQECPMSITMIDVNSILSDEE